MRYHTICNAIGAKITRTLVLILLAGILSACATRVSINVNAISDMERTQYGKKYFLTNVNDNVPSDDLYFKEFRRYFDYALQQKGYEKVDNRKQADLEIQLHYGISDGRTGLQTYSWPIYETFGGESMTITEKVTNGSGQTQTVRRTIYVPATVRQVGSSYETRSYTIYNRYVNLAAIPSDGDKKPVWNVNVHSVGESSDLRAIMPYLAAAAMPYLGENSGQQQYMELGPENPVIKEMRSLTMKPE